MYLLTNFTGTENVKKNLIQKMFKGGEFLYC